MNANERELILKDEVYQIVGAATVARCHVVVGSALQGSMEVCNQLGCGFL